ncbi:DNA helicase RecQ [Sulfurospirillum arcachonense]|uniref:DNA helicase RecQ n=1 Tax=Sulfurospirillum arcachonense TaxID=57666 RepID=UPI0004B1864C|nr:DNA helicase RecQ [Sulfurospirillum arcachonense]
MQNYFGFNSFRPLQRESIEAIINKKDLLTILPTGGGKSLCYQLPALYFEGQVTVVISPLIALINDQVINLGLNNIKADKLTSELNNEEISEVYRKLNNKELSLLYVSPERANMESFKALLRQVDVSFIVIDEAHCVSEWGHEFRPDYRKLHFLKEEFPHIPIAAFTATATCKVADDIVSALKLDNPTRLKGSFFRDNLILNVKKRVANGRKELVNFLKNYDDESGIIYTFTRKETEEIASFLQSRGFNALAYHAGLKSEIRKENQDKFIRDETKIIVATIAFGMGIDKSNVRFVVHMDLPKSMESYYQEIGRAGRDGLKSECLLLYAMGDVVKKSELMNSIEDEVYKNFAKNKIEELYNYANSRQCRHQAVTGYFEESLIECENLCDNCQKEAVEEIDITQEARMLLSTIYRSGQNFGSAHIVDVIKGSKNKKVIENGHDRLSVYGIGKEISKDSWGLVIDKLFEKKAVKRGDFRQLMLTSFGANVLKGKQNIYADVDIFEEVAKEISLDKEHEIKDENFEALREVRAELASQKGVPAYVVFSDATLKEIAKKLPCDEESFLDINGVGKVKLERYGEVFMNKVKELKQ